LQKCLDLLARHGDGFGKDGFQNGPALDKAVRSRFALRVGFPVQQDLLPVFKLADFFPYNFRLRLLCWHIVLNHSIHFFFSK
jgi:hypothetical protein